MDITLRTMGPDEVRHFLEVTEASFGASLPDDVWEDIKHTVEAERATGAFDGEAMVGTAGAYSLRFTVPGGEVPGAGVTMVGVLPSHRRRGVMTKMMRAQLTDIRERGEPIAALWASEDAIYGRFGYGAASVQALIDIPRHRSTFLDDSPVRGRIRLLEIDEALKVLPGVFDEVRKKTPGMFARSEPWWKHRILRTPGPREEGGPVFRAVVEHDHKPTGYALWQVHQRWEKGVSEGAVEVREVMATTHRAHLDLWKMLFGIDLVQSIRTTSHFLPSDHPLQLMLEQPRYLKFMLSNGLWVRIVDVAAALEARSYATEGKLKLGIRDTVFEDHSGTWEMDVAGGRARVTKGTGDADIDLSIAELGAMYLGQHTFVRLAAAGRIDARDAATIRRADDMWRTEIAPWCPEIF